MPQIFSQTCLKTLHPSPLSHPISWPEKTKISPDFTSPAGFYSQLGHQMFFLCFQPKQTKNRVRCLSQAEGRVSARTINAKRCTNTAQTSQIACHLHRRPPRKALNKFPNSP